MTESPFTPPAASVEIERPSPLKESDYVKAFLTYFVSALIAGTVCAGAAGMVLGMMSHGSRDPILLVSLLAVSAIIAVLIHYAIFKFAIDELIVPKLLQGDKPAA